jgi:hypothetical protein
VDARARIDADEMEIWAAPLVGEGEIHAGV